jgi:hypothetical protein
MTDEQINRAIAKMCGWFYYDGWHHPDGRAELPDYCTDLNAMHEAEKMLTYEQCAFFRTHLRERIEDHAASLFVWHSTARQRAEAFLRTLGKWEEVQG